MLLYYAMSQQELLAVVGRGGEGRLDKGVCTLCFSGQAAGRRGRGRENTRGLAQSGSLWLLFPLMNTPAIGNKLAPTPRFHHLLFRRCFRWQILHSLAWGISAKAKSIRRRNSSRCRKRPKQEAQPAQAGASVSQC